MSSADAQFQWRRKETLPRLPPLQKPVRIALFWLALYYTIRGLLQDMASLLVHFGG